MKADMINILYIQFTSDKKLKPVNAIGGAIEVQATASLCKII